MKNSTFLNFLKTHSKSVISFALIIALLITGITWPDKQPKADIISDLSLKYITTDNERPYSVLTAEIEGSLGDVSYYLYQSSRPLYFLSDQKGMAVRATSSDIDNGNVSVNKYSYEAGTRSWSLRESQTISSSTKISNIGRSMKYGQIVDGTSDFYSFGNIGGGYGIVGYIDNFGTSSYVPSTYGEYIVAYGGQTAPNAAEYVNSKGTVVEGQKIINKNFINYEKFSSSVSTLPYFIVNGNMVYDDANLSTSAFYRTMALFNKNSDFGFWSTSTNEEFSENGFYQEFTVDTIQPKLDQDLYLPTMFTAAATNTEIPVSFYATQDLSNSTTNAIVATFGNSGELNPSYIRTENENSIVYSADGYSVEFKINDSSNKKIESIKLSAPSENDGRTIIVKLPAIFTNPANEDIKVGRNIYILLRTSNDNNVAFNDAVSFVNDSSSSIGNKLMLYTDYMDFNFSNTYTTDGVTYFVNDVFYGDSNGSSYRKDMALKAYSSNTDKTSLASYDRTVMEIANGTTSYKLYGQLQGFSPLDKTVGVNFSISSLELGDENNLYSDGKSIYYSDSSTSSSRLELVTIENGSEYSYLRLNADNITYYRILKKNPEAFNSFSITGTVNNNGTSVSNNFTVYLSGNLRNNGEESFVEMNLTSSYSSEIMENWESISVENLTTTLPVEGRYPTFPDSESISNPYITLINYGEYELLIYSTTKPKYNSGDLEFGDDETDFEIYRYTSDSWLFENYITRVADGRISLPTKADSSAIDFLNYDLVYVDARGKETVVLKANSYYDDDTPKLRVSSIPVISDATETDNQYIFLRNSVGFYAFVSSSVVTTDGDIVNYPEGTWYVLVQNTWKKVSDDVASSMGLDSVDRQTFETYLRYSNDRNSAWSNAEEWSSVSWGKVNYFKFIPIYTASSGFNYIIYETSNGYQALEYDSSVGSVSITENGIRFGNSVLSGNNTNGLLLKTYSSNSWVNEPMSVIRNNVSNDGYYFINPEMMNSIIYSNVDLYDEYGNVIVSNAFSQSLIVSDSIAVSDIAATRPVNDSNEVVINGTPYHYVIVTKEKVDENLTYVTYISNNPFKYSPSIGSEEGNASALDVYSDNYPIVLYKQVWDTNTETWSSPELVINIDASSGSVDSLTTTFTEYQNGIVEHYYNQYPNGRVTQFSRDFSTSVDGRFVEETKGVFGDIPSNAYEVYYDSEGNEYVGTWTWKWSDTGAIVDYYYDSTGTKFSDDTHTHKFYKIATFQPGGNVNEFSQSLGRYPNFYDKYIEMGYVDVLGNWFNKTNGWVVTPSGNYGYYDENLNIVSSRPKNTIYAAAESVSSTGASSYVAEKRTVDDTSLDSSELRKINICSSDDIVWINDDISSEENATINFDRYSGVTFLDSSVEAILGSYVIPSNISSRLEYIQPKDSVTNYWIEFFDSCGNIYSPFKTDANSRGKVAKTLEELKLYFPNYGNVSLVLSGKCLPDGIAFDLKSFNATNVSKSSTEWYKKGDNDKDIVAPVVNAVYMVNHTLKISATDPGAYTTVFDKDGNRIYKEVSYSDVPVIYSRTTSKDYSKSPKASLKDSDGIPYFISEGGEYFELLSNNNATLVTKDGYTFLYKETPYSEELNGTSVLVEKFDENGNSTGDYVTLSKLIEKDGLYYLLADNYYIVNNVLYREVSTGNSDTKLNMTYKAVAPNTYASDGHMLTGTFTVFFKGRINDITNTIVKQYPDYAQDTNSTTYVIEYPSHGTVTNSGGKYIYSYTNSKGVKLIPETELVEGETQMFTFDDVDEFGNVVSRTWGVLLGTNNTTHIDGSTNPASENETYTRVSVTEFNDAKTSKLLVKAQYLENKVSFTRLAKKLYDSDISNVVNTQGNDWATLISTKDGKGIYTYQDSSNTIWPGYCVEIQPGRTIGDDGYIYFGDNKVSADIEYDEDGNQIHYEVTGIANYYIEILKDFNTDIAFSYTDPYGNSYSYNVGDTVTSQDPITGKIRTIMLDTNEFTFPVDVTTGELKVNVYVKDGANNQSTKITGPWTLKRVPLSSSVTWEDYFIDGEATNQIINEITLAINSSLNDTKKPEITGIFLYKGQLYIVAVDNDDTETGTPASGIGLPATYNYIYEYLSFDDENGVTYSEIPYYQGSTLTKLPIGTKLGRRLSDSDFDSDGKIKSEAEYLIGTVTNLSLNQSNGYMSVVKNEDGTIRDSQIDVAVLDIARNQSDKITVELSEDRNNSVLFGSVSQTIYEMLLAAKYEEGGKDDVAPIIKAIYSLNGVLYVEAEDNYGIKEYGYKWLTKSTSSGETVGTDDNGNSISFAAGADIPKDTIIWHGAAQQAINVPVKMTIYVTDTSGNTSYETVILTATTQLVYGTPTDPEAIEAFEDIGEDVEGKSPVIQNVYTYRGKLYVEGYDPDGNLRTFAYGFKPLDSMNIKSAYEGYNAAGTWISIPAGQTIKGGQGIYKRLGVQEVSIPVNITISMIDTTNLETEETYFIFKDNYVYKGTAPGDISGEVEDPDPSDNPTPTPGGGDTPTPTTEPTTDPSNPTPTPIDPTKPIPTPTGIPEDVNWDDYDYLFEVLDYNTNRTVYSIRLDKAAAIDCPRLENSVLYKYRIAAVDELSEVQRVLTNGTIRMTDTIPPTITKIWYSKNRIYVSAYDLGGFDDKPYSFSIEGSRGTSDYIANNNTVVLSGETINVRVRDAAGNVAKASVKIGSNVNTNNVLYESLNPKQYLYVNSSNMKSLAYWYAYINTTYGVDVSDLYLSEVNKSDNVDFEIKNNNVYLNVDGDGVISFYDNKTGKYLALNLRTLNTGYSYRSIVIQTGSDLDVSLAFKNKLLEQFGTIDGLTWYADGEILSRNGSMVSANREGIGQVKFVNNGEELNVYVLVVDSISGTTTNVNLKNENFAYTYKLRDTVDLATALRTNSNEISKIVIDNASKGVVTDNKQKLTFTSSGVKEIDVINCVDDTLGNVKFEVITITPYISTFTDIIGSDARSNIETLCEKGIIGNYLDNKYKPVNKMTTKEFLTMLNRIRLIYDEDFVINKVFTTLNLSEKDYDYYSSQNILINMTQAEVDNTISTYTLNKAITFEEVVKLISSTILYDKYHNESGLSAPAGLSDCAQEAIHLMSMGIIDSNDTRNGTRELTRAEISYILIKTIKYLEL